MMVDDDWCFTKVMKRSESLDKLQICPPRDSNTSGIDLWSNTLPLHHEGAPTFHVAFMCIVFVLNDFCSKFVFIVLKWTYIVIMLLGKHKRMLKSKNFITDICVWKYTICASCCHVICYHLFFTSNILRFNFQVYNEESIWERRHSWEHFNKGHQDCITYGLTETRSLGPASYQQYSRKRHYLSYNLN